MGEMPNTPPGKQDPKSNERISPTTASNKSPQTPQASAQDMAQGRGDGSAARVIAGAGSSGRRIVNGKLGRASFRK